jgi:hypothetical protein
LVLFGWVRLVISGAPEYESMNKLSKLHVINC